MYGDRQTIAIVVPSPKNLLALLLDPQKPFLTQIGIAYCSSKDQYSRKKGRELSTERLTEITVGFNSMMMDKDNPNMLYFTLNNLSGNTPSQFLFRINTKGSKTHYLGAYFGTV